MGWRVTWTPKGSPFPEWHDFHYEEPAQVLAQVRRIQGATNVRVIPIPGPTEPTEAIVGPPESDRTNHHKRGAERGKE